MSDKETGKKRRGSEYVVCDICGKKYKRQGIGTHKREAHGIIEVVIVKDKDGKITEKKAGEYVKKKEYVIDEKARIIRYTDDNGNPAWMPLYSNDDIEKYAKMHEETGKRRDELLYQGKDGVWRWKTKEMLERDKKKKST